MRARDGARGDAARLRVADAARVAAAQLEADLGQLRGLARAGLAADDDDLVRSSAARISWRRALTGSAGSKRISRLIVLPNRTRSLARSARRTRRQVVRYYPALRRRFDWTRRSRRTTVVPRLTAQGWDETAGGAGGRNSGGISGGKGRRPSASSGLGGACAPPFFYARRPAGRAICGASRGRNTSSTSSPERDLSERCSLCSSGALTARKALA